MESENLSSVDLKGSSQSISRKCYGRILTKDRLEQDLLTLNLSPKQFLRDYTRSSYYRLIG